MIIPPCWSISTKRAGSSPPLVKSWRWRLRGCCWVRPLRWNCNHRVSWSVHPKPQDWFTPWNLAEPSGFKQRYMTAREDIWGNQAVMFWGFWCSQRRSDYFNMSNVRIYLYCCGGTWMFAVRFKTNEEAKATAWEEFFKDYVKKTFSARCEFDCVETSA